MGQISFIVRARLEQAQINYARRSYDAAVALLKQAEKTFHRFSDLKRTIYFHNYLYLKTLVLYEQGETQTILKTIRPKLAKITYRSLQSSIVSLALYVS